MEAQNNSRQQHVLVSAKSALHDYITPDTDRALCRAIAKPYSACIRSTHYKNQRAAAGDPAWIETAESRAFLAVLITDEMRSIRFGEAVNTPMDSELFLLQSC
jgi:hypothetical protein